MTRRSTLLALFFALGAVVVAAAVALWPNSEGGQETERPNASQHKKLDDTPSGTNGHADVSAGVSLYFPSRRYVESGDEALEQLVEEPRSLPLDTADADADAWASAVLSALESGPSSSAAAPAIPKRVSILQVRVRDGIARVDFASAGLSGSSLEERLLVNSIVKTLTRLPQVRAVQFLIEGSVAETLMGHVTTTEPISSPD